MLAPLWIGLWAWLFCRPLSDPGQIFGWLKDWLYVKLIVKSRLPIRSAEAVMKVLIDCPKCHAGQIAFWWQVVAHFQAGYFSIPFVLVSIFVAICFTDLGELVDKWKNA